jgi:hypothetical protein
VGSEGRHDDHDHEIDFSAGGGGGEGWGGGEDDGDDQEDYGPVGSDDHEGYDNGNGHGHGDEIKGERGEEMNEALSQLHEERLLAQRVENVLNDALGFGLGLGVGGDDVSFISSDLHSRHSLDPFNSSSSFISSHPHHHPQHHPQHHQQNSSFEMLCKKYIQNFILGTEKYSRETNLIRRVNDWTNKMEPLLKEQEERGGFDIHDYSDGALEVIHQKIQQEGRGGGAAEEEEGGGAGGGEEEMKMKVHFSEIVQGKPSYEVSRVFLACLQLANLGNVNFEQSRGTVEDFDVRLLNEKSNRLQIENYRAPSVGTAAAAAAVGT